MGSLQQRIPLRPAPTIIPYLGDYDVLPVLPFKCSAKQMTRMNPHLLQLYEQMAARTLQSCFWDLGRYSLTVLSPSQNHEANSQIQPQVRQLVMKNGSLLAMMVLEKNWSAIFSSIEDSSDGTQRAKLAIDNVVETLSRFFSLWITGDSDNTAKYFWLAHRLIRRQWNYVELVIRSQLCHFVKQPTCLDLVPICMKWWEPSNPLYASKLQATMKMAGSLAAEIIRRDFENTTSAYFDTQEDVEYIRDCLESLTQDQVAEGARIKPRSCSILGEEIHGQIRTLIATTSGSLLSLLWDNFFFGLANTRWDLTPIPISRMPPDMWGQFLGMDLDGKNVIDALWQPVVQANFVSQLQNAIHVAKSMAGICRATYRLNCCLPEDGLPIPCIVSLRHSFTDTPSPCDCEVRVSVWLTHEAVYLHAPVTFYPISIVEYPNVNCQGVTRIPLPFPPDWEARSAGEDHWQAWFISFVPENTAEQGRDEKSPAKRVSMVVEQQWRYRWGDLHQVKLELKFETHLDEEFSSLKLTSTTHVVEFNFNDLTDRLWFNVYPVLCTSRA